MELLQGKVHRLANTLTVWGRLCESPNGLSLRGHTDADTDTEFSSNFSSHIFTWQAPIDNVLLLLEVHAFLARQLVHAGALWRSHVC